MRNKIKIPIDGSSLKKAIDYVKSLGKATDETKDSVTDLGATFEDVNGDTATLSTKLGELEDRMYALADAGKANSKEFRDLAAEAGRLKAVQQETDLVVDRLGKTFGQKLTGGVQTAVDAFTIAQVTLEALGVESEGTAALMEKLFIAQSVADSFSSLEESTGVVTKLGKAIKATSLYQTAAAAATRVVTAANWLWNAALTANPIGAIIVAVTALIAAGYALVKMFQKSNETNREAVRVNEELNATLDAQREKHNLISESLEKSKNNRLALARAQGKSKEELRALELQLINNQIAEAKNNKEVQRATTLEIKRQLELAKSRGASKDAVAALEESLKKANEEFEKAEEEFLARTVEKTDALFRFKVEDEAAKTRAREEGASKRKQIADKEAEAEKAAAEKAAEEKRAKDEEALTKYKEILAETQDANEDYLQQKTEGEDYEFKEAERLAKESFDTRLVDLQTALNREVITQAEFNQLKLELETQYNNSLTAVNDARQEKIDEEAAKELEKERDKQIEREEILNEYRLKELDGLALEAAELDLKYEEELNKLRESLDNELITKAEYAELEKQLIEEKEGEITEIEERERRKREADEKRVNDLKIQAVFDTAQTVANVLELFAGENEKVAKAAFNINKGINIAQATMDTYTAAVGAFKAVTTGPTAALLGPAAVPVGIAAAAAAVTSGLLNVKKIAQTKFETNNVSGGASPASGSISLPTSAQAAPAPPSLSLFGNANQSVNIGPSAQQAGSRQQNEIRAYVVESDITQTQNTLSRYRQRSEIG